jgi:aminoglycoside/choline kinase family phosphotransferase
LNDRLLAIETFLARHGLARVRCQSLAGDASARRYLRLRPARQPPLILMDTPFPEADIVRFGAIGAILAGIGLSVPATIAADTGLGLALIEDFGDDTFDRRLAAGADPLPLYALAIDALVALHRRFHPEMCGALDLPVFDARRFVDQVMLFADVHMPLATGRPLAPADRQAFEAAWMAVVEPACAGPASLLLRDYHVGNLMVLARDGERAAGLLDFQDAGLGPVAYDLVSLLEDARRDVPDAVAPAMLERYLAAFPTIDAAAFRRTTAVLAAVRHTRIVAIFERLAVEQGKRGYLCHLPRVWRCLEARLRDPALTPVAGWFAAHVPAASRTGHIVAETVQ